MVFNEVVVKNEASNEIRDCVVDHATAANASTKSAIMQEPTVDPNLVQAVKVAGEQDSDSADTNLLQVVTGNALDEVVKEEKAIEV